MHIVGIDVGGSGIKGAPIDLSTGALTQERFRIPTPQPATPKAVADVVAEIVDHFGEEEGPIGATFPARVKDGVTLTASNVDDEWIGTDAAALFEDRTGRPVTVLNDADAAGVAEVRYGAGKGRRGLVMMLTFGTGIGSALFYDGELVPNTELGHLELNGMKAEWYAADRIRKEEDLSWSQWAGRVQEYLAHVEFLFAPDLIIIGGGVSKPKKTKKYLDRLDTQAPIVPAELRNEAGIIGAALAAARAERPELALTA